MKYRPRRRALAALVLLVAAAPGLVGCGGSGDDASSGDTAELRLAIGTPSWNAGFAPLAVAEAEKYFEQEKLKVTVQLFPSGTQIAQQVVSGQADIGLVTPEPVAIGQSKNAGLVYFAQYWTHWIYSLAVPDGSSVATLGDLQGKRVGVTAVASSGSTFMNTAMKSQGLDPSAVKLVPIGGGPQQISAVKDGQVDALAMWDTQYQIIENAGVKLKPLAAPGTENLFGGGFAVKASTLKDKKDVLVRFGRAMAKSMVFTQASPEGAVKDLWKVRPETKGNASTPEKQALAEQVSVLKVRMDGQKVGPADGTRWGYMEPDSVARTVQFMVKSGLIAKEFPPTAIYTDDLIEPMNKFSYDDIRTAAGKAS
jgi:NitT/TauT family transport system substrate-binding protein